MPELMKKIKRFSDEKHTLCKILVFVFAVAMTVGLSLSAEHSIVYHNGDSPLYISIADNFLDNGHFIQTHRDRFENFVVPPGYPAILTAIRLFSRNDAAIAIVQYILFGFSSVLLYCAERNLFGNIGGLSVIMYCLLLRHVHYCGPGGVLTETWYISVIILCIWLLSRPDIPRNSPLSVAYVASFIGVLIRPLLSILFFAVAAYMLVLAVKKEYSIARFAAMAVVCVLIVGANVAVNYRETGHYIVFEDYAGISVYLANNDVVKENGYDYSKSEYDYADEQFYEIYNNKDLDYYEVNEQLSALGNKYILTHPLTTLKNIVVKFWYLFFSYWYYIAFVAAAGAFFAYRRNKEKAKLYTVLLAFSLVFAVITSMGNPSSRYSYILLPTYTIFMAAAVETIAEYGLNRISQTAEKLKKRIKQ